MQRTDNSDRCSNNIINTFFNFCDKNPVISSMMVGASVGGFFLSGIKSFFSSAGELGEDIQKVISPYGFFGTA